MSATLLMFSPKCGGCGEVFPQGAQFCVHCGRALHIEDEASRPPAEVRPLRPELDDLSELPAPPSLSSLAPMGTVSLLGLPPVSPKQIEEALAREAAKAPPEDAEPKVVVAKGAGDSWSEGSVDDGELIAPAERPIKRWMILAGAAPVIGLLAFALWPSGTQKQLASAGPVVPALEEPASAPAATLPAPQRRPVEAPKPPTPAKAAAQPSPTKASAPASPAKPQGSKKDRRVDAFSAATAEDLPPKAAIVPATPPVVEPPAPKSPEAPDEAADFLNGD